jgi:hypothetical protein
LNFGHQEVSADPDYPDRYVIQISHATAYPDVLGWAHQGFNNRMAETHGQPNLWRYERPRLDLVWQRMTRSLQ